jgi:hypothetical protein
VIFADGYFSLTRLIEGEAKRIVPIPQNLMRIIFFGAFRGSVSGAGLMKIQTIFNNNRARQTIGPR